MTPPMFGITIACLIILFAILAYRFVKGKNLRLFVFQGTALAVIAAVLYKFFYSGNLIGMGVNDDLYFVIVLFVFMLMGMLANYGYRRFSMPKATREPFDFGLFIAPVLASPIVFIPLFAAFQDAQADLRSLTRAKLMIFLVAFQNGFFWKEYFDNLRKEKEKGDDAQKVSAKN